MSFQNNSADSVTTTSGIVANNTGRRVASLLAAVVGIAMVWGILLPAVSQVDTIRTRNDFLDSRGIDPSAKFFTDQAAGRRNAAVVEKKVAENPELFWSTSRQSGL